jgi:signal transduction histidine kinase
MKVLLVEDNHADARLFAELLSEVANKSFQLTTADTFSSAAPLVRSQDIVFLDLSLPDAFGIETVSRMVQLAGDIPIVVLTGNDDDRVAVEAMKAGAQDYLFKAEITPSLIARSARYAVERKAAEQQAKRAIKADAAAQRARLLSSLTAAITASFELDATLPEVAKLVVPMLGDYCAIELTRDAGTLERVATAGDGTAQGEELYLQLHARGRTVGALLLGMSSSGRTFDSELQQLADEVAERIALGVDNASLYGAAQRAIRGRDELLAVVSHDLRNPLNIVALALQAVAGDPEMAAAALPRAMRGVDRMQRLIEDLLDVARIDTGTLAIEPRGIDVAALADDLFEQQRTIAAEKKITLVRHFDRPPLGARADRHRLTQAITNLISNAFKFTPAGGTVHIGANAVGERVAIWVSDTGPGIPPEHLSHIFDRFWQPQRRRDGVGLGLAIVKGIVDAHGGAIEVDSVPGEGTTFRIVLDRAELRPTASITPLAGTAVAR